MNIYVSNLSFDAQDQDLKELFAPFGDVSSAKVVSDKFTGKSRGFGFVEMPDDAAAKTAISQLNDASLQGRNIKVVEARPKEEGAPRRSSGGGFGNNGDSFKKRW